MFKSRRNAIRRCRESQEFAERGGCKRRKLEGNSNITSNRVTIPPGFLCLGVKSNTIRKTSRTDKENLDSHRDCILNENLHGLFKGNSNERIQKPRRSSRLNRPEDSQSNDSITASEYFCRSFNTHQNVSHQAKESPRRGKTITRNNSKSLFREINERCARVQTKEPLIFNYPVIPILHSNCKQERFRPDSFCLRLARDVSIDVDQHDYLFNAKLSVRDDIRNINRRLRGEMTTPDAVPNRNDKREADNGARGENNFQYVPRCDWVFITPPRQRVVFPRAEGCAIQPAVICTTRKQSNIYELNPDVAVDLTGYLNRQNVPVDSRYMRHLASFEDKMDVSFNAADLGVAGQEYEPDEGYSFYEKRFKFSEPTSSAAHPFGQVTLRPVKTVKKMSRVNNFYSRKREGGAGTTPTGPGLSRSPKPYGADVTVVGRDGQYEIVEKGLPEREDSFSFKFKKNLFADRGLDADKFFNFGAEEVFNFEMQ